EAGAAEDAKLAPRIGEAVSHLEIGRVEMRRRFRRRVYSDDWDEKTAGADDDARIRRKGKARRDRRHREVRSVFASAAERAPVSESDVPGTKAVREAQLARTAEI